MSNVSEVASLAISDKDHLKRDSTNVKRRTRVGIVRSAIQPIWHKLTLAQTKEQTYSEKKKRLPTDRQRKLIQGTGIIEQDGD